VSHLLALLPALYFLLLGLALLAALRRWYDAPPRWLAAAFLALPLALFWPALGGGRILLPLEVLRLSVPFRELPPDPGGTIFLHRDLVHQIAPWTLEVKRALLAGRWPLWNPRVGAGMPLMADPQSQPFQPLVVLGYPFPVWTAAAVSAALRVHLALVFTFLLLRRQSLGEPAALAGSLAFGLGNFLLLWLGWPIANAAALLPAVLYAVTACDQRGAGRDFALLAAATAALMLAGHPETMLYALGLAGLFLASRVAARRPGGGRWRLLGPAALALAVGAGIAAPPLVLAYAYLPTSSRATVLRYTLAPRPLADLWRQLARPESLQFWSRRSVSRLLLTAAPRALGDQFTAYWGDTNFLEDAGGFAGTATLLAALLAVPAAAAAPLAAGGRRGRLPQERLMLLVLAASLLLLAQPPGCENLVARLPIAGATAAHRNGRIQVLVGFCLAYLAACQLERWTRRGDNGLGEGGPGDRESHDGGPGNGGARHRGPAGDGARGGGPGRMGTGDGVAGDGVAGDGVAGDGGSGPSASGGATPLAVAAVALVLAGILAWGYLGHINVGLTWRYDWNHLQWMWIQAGFLAAAALLLAWLARRARPPGTGQPRRGRRRWAAFASWAFCGLIAGELLLQNAGANPSSSAALAFPVTPPVAFLQRHLPAGGSGRMLGVASSFPANFPEAYGLADVRIDNPSLPAGYDMVTEGLSRGNRLQPIFGRPAHPFYDFLGVRYVITRPGIGLPFPLVFRDAAGWVFERPRPLPRLLLPARAQIDQGQWRDWLEGNDDFALRDLVAPGDLVWRRWRARQPDSSELAVSGIEAERVHGRASLVERRLLAASIYQDGGWRVLAAGRRLNGVLVNGIFAGAWLPAGDWDVELIYRPPRLLAGCLLTALAVALGCALWVPPPARRAMVFWDRDGG
jgi:hypothetical protein